MILVTGGAGFIGSTVCQALLAQGESVIALDNLNDYYDVNLKEARLARLQENANLIFAKIDISDQNSLLELFKSHKIRYVINLAAQAGVRYSITNPGAYVDSNLVGFANILEMCRQFEVEHLVYASTSSVYGANTCQPFSEQQATEHPISLYAATKKANEMLAHSYAAMYDLPCSGLRFFTVYGPWGRPDMALFKFTKAILADQAIDVYNHGDMVRDFTYVDDIVKGILAITQHIPQGNPDWNGDNPDPGSSKAPYAIYNIGNNQPIKLMKYIEILEKKLGKTAQKNFMDLQNGDVASTYASVEKLQGATGYKPSTTVEEGIDQFVKWYREYYQV